MSEVPVIIIPARYGSSRFPGKPMQMINGAPLIVQTWRAARETGLTCYVATDDERIANVSRFVGADVIHTGACNNGTERCAEAALKLGHTGPVVNWQGDSPLVPAEWIHQMIMMRDEVDAAVVTPVQLCGMEQTRSLRDDYAFGKPGGTMAVFDAAFQALYFSKAPIPSGGPLWQHIGIYCYSAAALAQYGREPSQHERSEGLEQLRFLERRIPIICEPVTGDPIWEVNNPHDVAIVERKLMERRGAPSRT